MCSRKDCPTGLPGTYPHGRGWYCELCNRIAQARNKACIKGKEVP